MAAVLSSTITLAAELKSRIQQQSVSPSQPKPAAPTSNPALANITDSNSTVSKRVSTGTIQNAYGSFCGPRTGRCVAFCATPSGALMDDDYNNFFCYTSHSIAGDPLTCKSDDECQDDDQG